MATTTELFDAVWLDARVATMSPGGAPYGALEGAAVAVREGRIVFVGPSAALDAGALPAERVHRCEGRWMTPGLVDCHTHLVYAGNRALEFEQRLQGVSYAEIARRGGGIVSTVRACREASAQSLYAASLPRLRALAAEGVTLLEIKSGYGLDLDTECRLLEVARQLGRDEPGVEIVTTYLGAHAVPPEFVGDADGYLDQVVGRVLPEVAARGLADQVDAFCESIAFDLAQTERVLGTARALGLPVKLHAEQLSDMGGAALAARLGALSCDHLEYVGEESVRAMAAAGTVAVLLPGAFYFLRERQVPPVDLFRRHAVPMALASDSNPGSAPVTSLLLMLNMGCTLFGLTPEEALAGVTREAARALGRADRLGVLAPGMQADFVLWDIEHPAELAYRVGFNPCHAVVKRGVRLR